MTSWSFAYRSARSVEEAYELWAGKSGSRYLAGGTDLIPQVRAGARQAPAVMVDIKRIPGLWEIGEDGDGAVSVGATATISSVAADALIQERYPALVECCLQLGSYPLRNIATMAGNICNASPCADTSAALLALDAEVRAAGPDGERGIPIKEFFEGPGIPALKDGELVTSIVLPAENTGGSCHYGRIARRRRVDISTVAVLMVVLPDRRPKHRISLLSVAPRPLRVPEAEAVLDEKGPDGASEAAGIAMGSCSPISDVRGTAEYRREMVGVLVRRGVEALAGPRER